MWFFSSRKSHPRTPDRPRRACRPRLEALEDRCLLSAGALDPTFGSGAGYVTTALSGNDWGAQVLLQPSGNIVAAGWTSVPVTTTTTVKGKTTTATTNVKVFGVTTYNPDGSLDTAFGSGGIVRQPFVGQGTSGAYLYGAALEPTGATGDSKILLAGQDQAQGGLALMRLNPDGSLDTTFGGNGQVITPFQTSGTLPNETARAVAMTSNGQILAVGHDQSHTLLLARYNPDGSLDTTFGSGGKATTVFTSTATNFEATVSALAQQPDGKFVVVGTQGWYVSGSGTIHRGMVLRYNANGSLDPSFGNGGIVTTVLPIGSVPSNQDRGVAIYPNAGTVNDGKIIVVGFAYTASPTQSTTEWTVQRYDPDGSVDASFGNGAGYVTIANPQPSSSTQAARAVTIESDGKPVVVGVAGPSVGEFGQVARLNLDGSLDATFGNGGLVTTGIGSTDTEFAAVAIQPDGKIVAAGDAYSNGAVGTRSFAVARYLPSEPQVGSFTASPNPVAAGSVVTLTASNLTDGNPNSTITQVAFYRDSNGDGVLQPGTDALLGYGTRNADGTWTYTFSTAGWAPGSYTLFAQAQDSDGVLGDPLALTLQVL